LYSPVILVIKKILKSVVTTNTRMLHYVFQDGKNNFLPLFELLGKAISIQFNFLVLSTL